MKINNLFFNKNLKFRPQGGLCVYIPDFFKGVKVKFFLVYVYLIVSKSYKLRINKFLASHFVFCLFRPNVFLQLFMKLRGAAVKWPRLPGRRGAQFGNLCDNELQFFYQRTVCTREMCIDLNLSSTFQLASFICSIATPMTWQYDFFFIFCSFELWAKY